jgi:hypothetical protein
MADNASNQLNYPFDAILDYSNILYIADYRNYRVQKYPMGSSTGLTVAGQANATGGSSANQLKQPSRVLVESNGDIFVADSGNHRIQFWANGASSGTTIAGTG